MKLNPILLLAAAAILLAGCSSTPTKVDTGPIRASTFSFVDPGPRTAPAYADNRQSIHPLVQGAITRSLAARGVARAASGGDVTVGYLVIVGNNATTTSLNDYFGYGDAAMALHDKAQKAYSNSKNPNYFEAGTLVIDIVDAKTFKLLKRGYASRPVLRDVSADTRTARLQEVVDEILRDVRFKQ